MDSTMGKFFSILAMALTNRMLRNYFFHASKSIIGARNCKELQGIARNDKEWQGVQIKMKDLGVIEYGDSEFDIEKD